jgi:putative endonuclease
LIYVYILQSLSDPSQYYIGITEDLKLRLKQHNAGEVAYTAKFKPWKIKTILLSKTAKGRMRLSNI